MNPPKGKTRRAVSEFLKEFTVLFVALIIALALLPTIESFASTASAKTTDANAASLIALIPLLVVVVILGAIVAVLYKQFVTFRSRAYRLYPESNYPTMRYAIENYLPRINAWRYSPYIVATA